MPSWLAMEVFIAGSLFHAPSKTDIVTNERNNRSREEFLLYRSAVAPPPMVLLERDEWGQMAKAIKKLTPSPPPPSPAWMLVSAPGLVVPVVCLFIDTAVACDIVEHGAVCTNVRFCFVFSCRVPSYGTDPRAGPRISAAPTPSGSITPEGCA